jgi:hypothetical protein
MRNGLFALCVLGVCALPSRGNATPEWHSHGHVGGLPVEVRDVPGTDLEEVRVHATVSEKLEALCDAIFAKNLGSKIESGFKKRVVLRETESERWTYEQVGVPFSADRDYVMHVKLESPASSGRCAINFETEDDPQHPPTKDAVRMVKVRGSWVVEPSADGRMTVVYQLFSNPGGNIPSFLIKFGQPGAVVDFMKKILARASVRP